MKIEAADVDVSKLLKTGILVIPRFQRPYSWRSENIRDFWNDIVGSDEGTYFIGSMVVYSMKQDRFGIVDGQQRLTTITILLCAIRDHLADLGEVELAKGVHNYIETRDRDNVKSFILKTETSFPYLQDRIQRFGEPELNTEPREEERRLQQAYNNLNRLVEDHIRKASSGLLTRAEQKEAKISSLKELREIVFNLKVIKIELDDEDDAYVIFETLNTRGQDLTLSDLLKNSIGSLIDIDGDIDLLKISWDEIIKNISACGDAVKVDTFFVHSWSSRFPAVTKQKAFKAFKSKLQESVGATGAGMGRTIAVSHLNAFKDDSERYLSVYQPEGRFPKFQYLVSDSLKALRIFNVEQQMPYILALLRAFSEKKISYKSLRKAMRSVESFHFQFNAIMSRRSSGSISSMYARAARNLYEAPDTNTSGIVINELTNELKDRKPGAEEFSLQFRTLTYNPQGRGNSLIRYVLEKLSRHENLQFDTDIARLTVEHIHPRSKLDALWKDEVVDSIGNLILLSESRNLALANKSYAEKAAIFRTWGAAVPAFVRASEDWSPTNVSDRAANMAIVAYDEVWSI